MLRSILLVFCINLASLLSYSQDYKPMPDTPKPPANEDPPGKKFDWSKVYVGGGMGMQFGSYTYVDVSPVFGYRFDKELSAGFGISYQFLSIRNPKFSSHTYGGGPFARYIITKNLFAHIEYQILNSEFYLVDRSGNIVSRFREDVHYPLIGGGFQQPIGGNSFLVMMVLYNLNESSYSIYPNPIYRLGINLGL